MTLDFTREELLILELSLRYQYGTLSYLKEVLPDHKDYCYEMSMCDNLILRIQEVLEL